MLPSPSSLSLYVAAHTRGTSAATVLVTSDTVTAEFVFHKDETLDATALLQGACSAVVEADAPIEGDGRALRLMMPCRKDAAIDTTSLGASHVMTATIVDDAGRHDVVWAAQRHPLQDSVDVAALGMAAVMLLVWTWSAWKHRADVDRASAALGALCGAAGGVCGGGATLSTSTAALAIGAFVVASWASGPGFLRTAAIAIFISALLHS
jgi:hypothetical protein